MRSLKSKELAERHFIIYIPAEPGHLWHHLVDIKNNAEDKGWKCNWHLENYSDKEETTEIGTQDGKPVRRTVLGVETANGKYWVDFPRTLATLTEVIEERYRECEERMQAWDWLTGYGWLSRSLTKRFCDIRDKWSTDYIDSFNKKLKELIFIDPLKDLVNRQEDEQERGLAEGKRQSWETPWNREPFGAFVCVSDEAGQKSCGSALFGPKMGDRGVPKRCE